jgi:hypothetical protein
MEKFDVRRCYSVEYTKSGEASISSSRGLFPNAGHLRRLPDREQLSVPTPSHLSDEVRAVTCGKAVNRLTKPSQLTCNEACQRLDFLAD